MLSGFINNRTAGLLKVASLAILVWTILIAHDHNLYPHLSALETIELSTLRWGLLAAPCVFAYLIYKVRSKIATLLLWIPLLLTIPYTLYSTLEIRHVSELCRLESGTYFTDVCSNIAWQMLPTLTYAIVGLLVFMLISRSLFLFRSRIEKISGTFALISYCSFASIIGIMTRVNIWDVFTDPIESANSIRQSIQSSFWQNSLLMIAILCGTYLVIIQFTHLMSAVRKNQA